MLKEGNRKDALVIDPPSTPPNTNGKRALQFFTSLFKDTTDNGGEQLYERDGYQSRKANKGSDSL